MWKEEGIEANEEKSLRLKVLWGLEKGKSGRARVVWSPWSSIESQILRYSHIRRKCSRLLFARLKDDEEKDVLNGPPLMFKLEHRHDIFQQQRTNTTDFNLYLRIYTHIILYICLSMISYESFSNGILCIAYIDIL